MSSVWSTAWAHKVGSFMARCSAPTSDSNISRIISGPSMRTEDNDAPAIGGCLRIRCALKGRAREGFNFP
jgi:hypothetical protein